MRERVLFIGHCVTRGLDAVTNAWLWTLGVIGLLAIAGIAVQDHVPHTGPRWLKVAILTAIVVVVLLEGAFQQVQTAAAPPTAGPPIQLNAETINYTIIDASNAQNVAPTAIPDAPYASGDWTGESVQPPGT